jgi:hypothetical protein
MPVVMTFHFRSVAGFLLLMIALLLAASAFGETYKWTDADGNLNFTDDPATIPQEYRQSVITDGDSGVSPAVDNHDSGYYQNIVETLERKHAQMPAGQVLSEKDINELVRAKEKLKGYRQ